MGLDVEKLRRDFPALHEPSKGRLPVYLDNACMTLRPRPVLDAMEEYETRFPGCHGRAAHEFARRTTDAFEAARNSVARWLGAPSPRQVVFTRNATESINMVAAGFPWREGDAVLTGDMEHNSNLLPWYGVARRRGVRVQHFSLAPDSTFDPRAFAEALTPDVRLVAVSLASNVTGVALPIEEIVRSAHTNGSRVLLDASQGMTTHPVDVGRCKVDLLALSMHKSLGPTGVGVLYGEASVLESLTPLLYGGEMIDDVDHGEFALAPLPRRLEAGLQNYAGVIGAGRAAEYLAGLPPADVRAHLLVLNRIATEGLGSQPRIRLVGPDDPARRHGILNFHIDGIPSEHVGRLLDESRRIMVRAGHHCAHSWYRAQDLPTTVRASFFAYNTREEAALLAEAVRDISRFFG